MVLPFQLGLSGGSAVFHAGTTNDGTSLKSSGGRVLSVTGVGSDLSEARDKAYRVLSAITLQGSHYRSDIALNASIAEKGNSGF
jgi:phosphoribosylamine--glycine ligase